MAGKQKKNVMFDMEADTINHSSEDEGYQAAIQKRTSSPVRDISGPKKGSPPIADVKWNDERTSDGKGWPSPGTALPKQNPFKYRYKPSDRILVVLYTWTGPTSPIEISHREARTFRGITTSLRKARSTLARPEQASLLLVFKRSAKECGPLHRSLGICPTWSKVCEKEAREKRSCSVYRRCPHIALPTEAVGVQMKVPQMQEEAAAKPRLHINVALRPEEMGMDRVGDGSAIPTHVFRSNERFVPTGPDCTCGFRRQGGRLDEGDSNGENGEENKNEIDNDDENDDIEYLAVDNVVYIEISGAAHDRQQDLAASNGWIDRLGFLSNVRFTDRRQFLARMVDFALQGSLNYMESQWTRMIDGYVDQVQRDSTILYKYNITRRPAVEDVWNSDLFWDTVRRSSQHRFELDKQLDGLGLVRARLESDLGLSPAELPLLAHSVEAYGNLSARMSKTVVEPITEMSEMVHKLVQYKDSSLSVQLSDSMWWLSWITFIFLPISTIASVFGMNVSWFEKDKPTPFYFFYAVIPSLAILLVFYYVFTRIVYPHSRLRDAQIAQLERHAALRKSNKQGDESFKSIIGAGSKQLPLWVQLIAAVCKPFRPVQFRSTQTTKPKPDCLTRLWISADRRYISWESRQYQKLTEEYMEEKKKQINDEVKKASRPGIFARLFGAARGTSAAVEQAGPAGEEQPSRLGFSESAVTPASPDEKEKEEYTGVKRKGRPRFPSLAEQSFPSRTLKELEEGGPLPVDRPVETEKEKKGKGVRMRLAVEEPTAGIEGQPKGQLKGQTKGQPKGQLLGAGDVRAKAELGPPEAGPLRECSHNLLPVRLEQDGRIRLAGGSDDDDESDEDQPPRFKNLRRSPTPMFKPGKRGG